MTLNLIIQLKAADVHWQVINLNSSKSEVAAEIHPKILTSLAALLAKFFNTSHETGKIDVANYRPICLASVVCKILERLLNANTLQYLKQLPF